MEKIIVGFSKAKGFMPVSWAIMAFEASSFSHAYLKIPSTSLERTLVYEATGKGIYFKSIEAFENHSLAIEEYEIEVTPEQKKLILQYCVDNSGKSYGRLQICGILIKKSLEKIGIYIGDLFPNGNREFICSELVARALQILRIQVQDDLDMMGVKDLRNYVKNIAKQIL